MGGESQLTQELEELRGRGLEHVRAPSHDELGLGAASPQHGPAGWGLDRKQEIGWVINQKPFRGG